MEKGAQNASKNEGEWVSKLRASVNSITAPYKDRKVHTNQNDGQVQCSVQADFHLGNKIAVNMSWLEILQNGVHDVEGNELFIIRRLQQRK